MIYKRTDLVPVSKNSVVRYLTDQGWERKNSRDGRLLKLTLAGDGSSDEVNLIFSNSPDEEKSEVAAAIDTIVQLYDVPRLQITQALGALAYDLGPVDISG
jgi:hypothetical protein